MNTSSKIADKRSLERMVKTDTAPIQSGRTYSFIIKWMRIILPLIAIAILAIVLTWSTLDEEQIAIIENPDLMRSAIGKNELIDPRFQSKDEKDQPYTITADRAIQSADNEDLIILETPVADMELESGNWIALKAKQGAFRQDSQRLLLRGDVNLFHDEGYQLETEQLHIDLKDNLAWSDQLVYGQGPAGTINAKGLRANAQTDHLVFIGPGKLILEDRGPQGLKSLKP